jgi:hypothetical protein
MKNAINNFGRNAGRIWATLNIYGPLSKNILIKKTRLKENDFYVAIGWLARENKIYKNGQVYELKETNLISKIGLDAGKVWNLLNSQGKCNVSNIVKINKIKIQDAYSALGWLAREDKIRISKGKQINYVLK